MIHSVQKLPLLLLFILLASVSKAETRYPCPTDCRCFKESASNIGLKCRLANFTSTRFLSEIPFANLVSYIDLTDNNITVIENNHLSDYSNLSTLILKHNDIEYIESHAFIKLGSLKHLSLSFNKLQILSPELFQENVVLEELDLSYNKIQVIPNQLFKYNSGLAHLKLHHNHLVCIEEGSFDNLVNLETLYLDNNNLTTFYENNFDKLPINTLTRFSAHNNEVICDCNVRWLPGWLVIRKRVALLDIPVIRCASPPHLKNKALELLEAHDFACLKDDDRVQNVQDGYIIDTHRGESEINWNQMDEPASSSFQLMPSQSINRPQNDGVFSSQNLFASSSKKADDKSLQYCPAARVCPEKCTCLDGVVDCSNKGLDHVPFNIPEDAVELLLHTNKITSIPDHAFSKLSKLIKLDICNNHVQKIAPHAFRGLTQLSQLSMYSNQITDLPADVFQNLPRVNIILLNANRISCLRNGLFDNLTNLRLLSLFGNNIRAIEEGTLDSLKSTTTFHLGNNPLICDCNLKWIKFVKGKESSTARCDFPDRVKGRTIDEMKPEDFTCEGGEQERTANAGKCFIDLPCPEECECTPSGEVSCTNSGLTSIPSNLPKYSVELDLSGNKISKVLADGSFESLPNLRHLDLSRNRIGKIEAGAFEGAFNLHYLDLKQNELTHIESGVFAPLKNLTSLELRENFFKCIENTTFSGLRKLTRLSLAENTIKTIQEGAFDDLPLLTLNLLGNHLVCNCHMSWFNEWLNNKEGLVHGNPRCQQPSSLKDLPVADLNNNDLTCKEDDINACTQITQCPEGCSCDKTFVRCQGVSGKVPRNIPPETTHLSITSAFIRVFDPQQFEYLPNLEVLDLSHNYIASVIPAPSGKTFKGLRRLKKLNLGYNYIKCVQPDSFSVMWELEELDLNANAISQIFESTFQNMTHIRKLDLSGNPIYCDCSLKWLASPQWQHRLNHVSVKCSEPERMMTKSVSELNEKYFTCEPGEPPNYVIGKCDPCSLKPCNGGTCKLSNRDLDFECECSENYEGRFCEKIIDYCYEKPCQNGGICKSHPDSNKFICTCQDGFEGNLCEVNVDDCEEHQCQNKAKCVDGLNEYTCDCGIGYSGSFCEIDLDICEYGRNPCRNGADCVDLGSDYQCRCQEGFEGKNCEKKVELCLDEHKQPYCLNGGSCKIDNFGQMSCNCLEGFEGPKCEVIQYLSFSTVAATDLFLSSPCSLKEKQKCLKNQGTCIDVRGEAKCKCFEGYSGESCEHQTSVSFTRLTSSVHAIVPWKEVQNFTFIGTFNPNAGKFLTINLKNMLPGCLECFQSAYVQNGKIGIALKLSEGENSVVYLKSDVIVTSSVSKFSVILSQQFVSIIDLNTGSTVSKVISASSIASKNSDQHGLITLGYESDISSEDPVKNLDSFGCLQEFYVNFIPYHFESAVSLSDVKTGACVQPKIDPKPAVSPSTTGFYADGPDRRHPTSCGEQKMQTVFHEGCESTREYKIVSHCTPKCRNEVWDDSRGAFVEDDETLCCSVSRYRDYTIKLKCPDGSKSDNTKVRVIKKCECIAC